MRKIRNKRIVFYAAALALLFFGGKGTDIGRLRPVELVQLYQKGELLFLATDTGDVGWGLTVEQAVGKLKETTSGQIYLDTADYLLVGAGAEEHLPAMGAYLKKKTKMAYGPEDMDLEEASAYLRVHRPTGTIGKCQKPLEMLSFEGGKILLKKFQQKRK